MPSGNNKQSLADIDVGEYIVPFLQTVFTIGMAVFLIWFYFNVYKPEEKNYIKKTRMAYRALEQEARQLFRKDGFVFSEDDRVDRLCQTLAQRNTKDEYEYIPRTGVCVNDLIFVYENDTYELKNDVGEIVKLNQLEVTEVVMKRLIEILEFSKKQIKLLTKSNINYIVISGG